MEKRFLKEGMVVYELDTTQWLLKPVTVGKLNRVSFLDTDGVKHRIKSVKALNRYQAAEINRHLADLVHAEDMLMRIWAKGDPCRLNPKNLPTVTVKPKSQAKS